MKKIIASLILALCLALPAIAEGEANAPIWDHGDNVASLSYRNVNVYRILDHKDAYVVLYQKQGLKIGQAVLPKKWAKEQPRKLLFRNKPKGMGTYMSVFYNDGEFYKVILTLSPSRLDAVWGTVPTGATVDGTDADTLDIEY